MCDSLLAEKAMRDPDSGRLAVRHPLIVLNWMLCYSVYLWIKTYGMIQLVLLLVKCISPQPIHNLTTVIKLLAARVFELMLHNHTASFWYTTGGEQRLVQMYSSEYVYTTSHKPWHHQTSSLLSSSSSLFSCILETCLKVKPSGSHPTNRFWSVDCVYPSGVRLVTKNSAELCNVGFCLWRFPSRIWFHWTPPDNGSVASHLNPCHLFLYYLSWEVFPLLFFTVLKCWSDLVKENKNIMIRMQIRIYSLQLLRQVLYTVLVLHCRGMQYVYALSMSQHSWSLLLLCCCSWVFTSFASRQFLLFSNRVWLPHSFLACTLSNKAQTQHFKQSTKC